MKTADFHGELTPDGRIAVPPEILAQLPPGEPVQVQLQWDVSGEDVAWREAGLRRFDAAYCEADSVYEALAHDPPTR